MTHYILYPYSIWLNNFRIWPQTDCDLGAQLVWRHRQAHRDSNRCEHRCHKRDPDFWDRGRRAPPPPPLRHLRIPPTPAGSRGRWERGIAWCLSVCVCVIRTFQRIGLDWSFAQSMALFIYINWTDWLIKPEHRSEWIHCTNA